MKADAKPTFADVAQLIAKGPAPDLASVGLSPFERLCQEYSIIR